ncbi:hypothetical protein HMPREF1093_03188 [Hungatella hathewayi 12489931]|uniref:hypothetical protein n=1 Tax=Hungatella hathewayi TaxID=154046 RepID=UPI0002D181C8|nr:hypothetical protein [Hungatella hathewayi]ENY93801.1 hypothetical protein HMPREF1093_03188 [Hungatella hathewayi 12489931]
MMAEGWVKLHRKLMDNDLWKEKPFSRGQAWVDLIMLASHKDKEFLFDSVYLPIYKGEIITSKRKLGTRWGWSNSKVDKFLFELEKVKMLSVKSDTKKSTLKITNYEQYQGFDSIYEVEKTTGKATRKRQSNDTQATPKRTINNVKNIKNEKNIKKKDIAPAALPSEMTELQREELELLGYLVGEREYTAEELQKMGYE